MSGNLPHLNQTARDAIDDLGMAHVDDRAGTGSGAAHEDVVVAT